MIGLFGLSLLLFAADGQISGDFLLHFSRYIPRYRVLWEYGKTR